MEDLHTIKGHYAYMLRVDLDHSDNSEILIDKWMSNYGCSSFLFGREYAKHKDDIKKLGKAHYQGIVWFEQKLSNKDMNARRNWWIGKTNKTSQGHAFTSARKIKTLASYSSKDANLYTNLTTAHLDSIPLWKNKEQEKTRKKDLLEKKLEKMNLDCNDGLMDFYIYFDEIFWEIYDRPPSRVIALRYARKYKYMSVQQYYQIIGAFPHY